MYAIRSYYERVGDAPKRASGTRIRAWPDPQFFDAPTIPLGELERLLRSKAVLLPGLDISLTIEGGETKSWRFRITSYNVCYTKLLR